MIAAPSTPEKLAADIRAYTELPEKLVRTTGMQLN